MLSGNLDWAKPGVFEVAGICYGSAMRRGGAVRKATIVGLTIAIASCGSRNSPPTTTAAVNNAASAASNVVGTAGTPNTAIAQAPDPAGANYPDPSKLLDSDDAGSSSASLAHPGRASNSGLSLEVHERGPGKPWLVRIVNRGDEPAELAADTRLLWFEVKVPSKKKQSLCRLPEPLSPGGQPDPRLIVHLEPGEGVEDQFDPRLYCFAEGDQKLLVPGAEITPHFGWPEAPPRKRWKRGKRVEEPVLQRPPFVARRSVDADMGRARHDNRATPTAAARLTSAGVTGADKHLEGATLTLQSEYVEWAHQNQPPPKNGEDSAKNSDLATESSAPQTRLAMRLVQGSDAKAEHDATVQLTLSNQSPLPSYVYFRREMVSYEIAGPAGIAQCPGRLDDRTPERDAFVRLERRGKRTYSTRLAELCPKGTFAIPGLYLVYARFDATMSGQDQGLDAFVGQIYSRSPAPIRIRTGEQAILQKHPMQRTAEPNVARATAPGAP
jgi:hypothetical protein